MMMKINKKYIIYSVTLFKPIYDAIVKFVTNPFLWGLFFFIVFGFIAYTIIREGINTKLKDERYEYFSLSSVWIVGAVVNLIAGIICDEKQFNSVVNNYYLDLFNAFILFITLLIAWKGRYFLGSISKLLGFQSQH